MTNFEIVKNRITSSIRDSAYVADAITKAPVTTPERRTLAHVAVSAAYDAGVKDGEGSAKQDTPEYMYMYLKLSAGHTTDGNPRRLYIVKRAKIGAPSHYGMERVAIFIENYDGNQEVMKHYPEAVFIAEINITPGEFKTWMNVKKTDEKYQEEEQARKELAQAESNALSYRADGEEENATYWEKEVSRLTKLVAKLVK